MPHTFFRGSTIAIGDFLTSTGALYGWIAALVV